MLNSTTLEVAIGMALIYLLLSLLCTAVNEAIAGLLGARGVVLEKGIRNLFTEGTMQARDAAGKLPRQKPRWHPPSSSRSPTSSTSTASFKAFTAAAPASSSPFPSSGTSFRPIFPSRTFASALFDLLFPATGASPLSFESMLTDVQALPPSCARQALLTMIREAGGGRRQNPPRL